jgi:hypothetical protein
VAGRPGLGQRDQGELGDEAVVVAGLLAVQPVRTGVADQVPTEARRRQLTPRVALVEPRHAAGRHEQPDVLGHGVVVPGRALAVERRQVLLVPPKLAAAVLVVLEQVLHLGPLVEKPPDPHPGDQAYAELDPAGPVDAGEQRVLRPPRAELAVDRLGVLLVAGEPVRRRELGQVVVSRELPDLLDVAGHRLVPLVDREREHVAGRPPAGHRIEEPVGFGKVWPDDAEQGPVAGEDPVTGRLNGRPDPGGNRVTDDRVDTHGAPELRSHARRGRCVGSWTHPPSCPLLLPGVVHGPA